MQLHGQIRGVLHEQQQQQKGRINKEKTNRIRLSKEIIVQNMLKK